MAVNFNLLNRNYMWYSTYFHCHKDLAFFENSTDFKLQLVRIKYTKLSFNLENRTADFRLKILAPLDNSLQDQDIRVTQNNDGIFTITALQDADAYGALNLQTAGGEANYAGFIGKDSFKLMKVNMIDQNAWLVKFLIMDNDVITPENTTGEEGRLILADSDVEPQYDTDGYVLPSNSLNNMI